MTPDYEAIGRYHVAIQDARRLISERNGLLARAAAVLKNSIEAPQSGSALGKRCNFDALHVLLK